MSNQNNQQFGQPFCDQGQSSHNNPVESSHAKLPASLWQSGRGYFHLPHYFTWLHIFTIKQHTIQPTTFLSASSLVYSIATWNEEANGRRYPAPGLWPHARRRMRWIWTCRIRQNTVGRRKLQPNKKLSPKTNRISHQTRRPFNFHPLLQPLLQSSSPPSDASPVRPSTNPVAM